MKRALILLIASLNLHGEQQLTFSNNSKKKIHLIIKDAQTKELFFEQDIDENRTSQALHNLMQINIPDRKSEFVQCIIQTVGNQRSAYKSRALKNYPIVWNGTKLCNDRHLQALEYAIQMANKRFNGYEVSE